MSTLKALDERTSLDYVKLELTRQHNTNESAAVHVAYLGENRTTITKAAFHLATSVLLPGALELLVLYRPLLEP